MAALSQRTAALEKAFEVFNETSGALEASYRDLQQTVLSLSTRLEKAQSARLAEYAKSERLSRHLADLLESLPGAIVVLDGDGVIRESNSAATTLLNRPLIGCAWSAIVAREMRQGGSEDGNMQLNDGRWLSLSRRRLGQEPGEVLLLADVTDSRRMSELRKRRERLTEIGEMTARFAHDVRTPLASAILYSSQLDVSSPAQRAVVDKLTARLDDVGRMVNDMLGFAAGGRAVEKPCNVSKLLLDIHGGLDTHGYGDADIRVDAGDDSLTVLANRDALKGAVCNLLTNAVQAGASDTRIVLGAASDGDDALITVRDNGPGIADDVLPQIFEPFFTTRPQGTGLGLAVVRAVAEAHGGRVTVESGAGGTCFTISLPLAGGEAGDA